MKEKISFRDSRFYPVFFMVILSAILTFILAFSYQLSKDRVQMYQELSLQTNLLDLYKGEISELNNKLINDFTPDEINKLYKKYITKRELQNPLGFQYYEFNKDGQLTGYVFPVSAKGLWSTIKLLVAVEPDFSNYLGIKIIDQGETPGLGARITEDWFQEQFTGKRFHQGDKFFKLQMIEEGEEPEADQVSQITGATVSSKAVITAIQNELGILYKQNFSSGKDN